MLRTAKPSRSDSFPAFGNLASLFLPGAGTERPNGADYLGRDPDVIGVNLVPTTMVPYRSSQHSTLEGGLAGRAAVLWKKWTKF